jgi:hypothetical protein
MTGAENDSLAADALTDAVIEAARHVADDEWGQPPRLYALVRRADLEAAAPTLPETVRSAAADALIPIEQEPDDRLDGDPEEVLARIRWPADVAGCALVTEVLIGGDEPGADAAARQGRLTVGVLRDDSYACCLQLSGDESLIVSRDLADDLVTALLGTL